MSVPELALLLKGQRQETPHGAAWLARCPSCGGADCLCITAEGGVICLSKPACHRADILRTAERLREDFARFRCLPEGVTAPEPLNSFNSFNSYPNGKGNPAARLELPAGAFYGLAGDIVCALDPHTESDPAAVLLQLLAAFGNVIGNGTYFRVEGDKHPANLFVALVGETAKGRKGTSWGHVRNLFDFDQFWTENRIQGGLSSGEGLINAVRDEDPPADRRLLTLEPEFASVLRVMEREGNTISARLRDAWDGRTLRTMTKVSPLTATGAHISLIGHITKDELLRYLQRTETANGFANRVLWVFVKRSKRLPEGGDFFNDSRRAVLIERLRDAVDFAGKAQEVKRDEGARAIWREVYSELSADAYGLFGAVTSRAEAQVTRLSLLFALLDCSAVIRAEHLKAALAVWHYCRESARLIFGDATGDATADAILTALRDPSQNNGAGLTRTEINSQVFKRNKPSEQIDRALRLLADARLVFSQGEPTGGRGLERFYPYELNELNEKREGLNSFNSYPMEKENPAADDFEEGAIE